MFQNLRQGSQIYLLHKGMTPYLEMGTVETIPTYPMMGYYPQMPMMPMDITVRVGEAVTQYKQLPPSAEVANVIAQNSGEEVCIACSREFVNNELQLQMQKSVDAINSVPMHEKRIETLKQIHDQLNPEKVKEAQQAEELNSLRDKVTDLGNLVKELRAELKARDESSH
ncbi:MAG: hypothetical protein MJZ30_12415 [Paludibacteraceae bacterium]|nr:hypothetical protein [Paludibacteraceae bacterium]